MIQMIRLIELNVFPRHWYSNRKIWNEYSPSNKCFYLHDCAECFLSTGTRMVQLNRLSTHDSVESNGHIAPE